MNTSLNIPTAETFVADQKTSRQRWINQNIVNINKQIEDVFKYINTASNGEHYLKIYREIIITLDVEKNIDGMQDVCTSLKQLGYSVTLFDKNIYDDYLLEHQHESVVHPDNYHIFDTSAIGNGGQSFDQRVYLKVNGFSRKVKSVMILKTK